MKVGKNFIDKINYINMSRYGINFIILFIGEILFAQNENINWLFGFKDTLHNENCGIYLWHEDTMSLSFSKVNSELNFETTSAAISDKSGNLILSSNGCSIADSTHKIIQNGDDLNPGELHDKVCQNIGYIVPNGALFIPWPKKENKFVLLHLGAKTNAKGNFFYGPFYLTIIEQNDGKFYVSEKNRILIDTELESFSVIRHGNGNDWWIIVPEPNSNKYFTFLLTSNGLSEVSIQKTGLDFPVNFCKLTGLSGFSPDGTKYLRFNNSCGYLLFDFDRCSGLLSGCIYESVGHIVDDLSADFTFSSDSRYIYINKLDHYRFSDSYFINKMYRVDIEQIGKKASPYLEYELPYYFRFSRFFTSNKGQIYVLHSFSSENITKINNEENTNALELEVFKLIASNARTVPYFANFNLNKVDCDWVKTDNPPLESFTLFPNPIIDKVTINLAGITDANSLLVRDITGRKVITIEKKELNSEPINIDLSKSKSGLYIFEIRSKNKIYIQKTIKI